MAQRVAFLFCLLLAGWSLPLDAEETEKKDAMGQVREHLQDALRSLGAAGRLTYESQIPALKEKTDQALQETQRLLQELEQKMTPKPDEQKPTPEKDAEEGVSSI